MGFYGRLFRYKTRTDRAPLEDYLTEALADLLTRMPHFETSAFLNHAFGDTADFDFSSLLARGDVEWRTQEPVRGGIADLVLFVGGKPVLLIENKTWSGFQDHSTDEQEANQLTTYCKWLAEAACSEVDCGVLLITGTTASPEGFHGEDGPYAVQSRAQLTWAGLSRWFGRALASCNDEPERTWRDLAAELIEFLEEKKLSSEIYIPSDVSAAHLFIPSMERWRSTFESMWSGSEDVWSSFLSTRVSEVQIDTEGGMIWQWRYALDEAAPIRSYVGFGIRFPDQSEWYLGLGLPEVPHFLFLIATDRGSLRPESTPPADWVYEDDEAEFLTSKALGDFAATTDHRIDQLQAWGRTRLSEAKLILRSCRAE